MFYILKLSPKFDKKKICIKFGMNIFLNSIKIKMLFDVCVYIYIFIYYVPACLSYLDMSWNSYDSLYISIWLLSTDIKSK